MPRLRPKQAQRRTWEALELDELWTFVGRKKRKVWLWLAVEHASRRIVAWVLGRRDAATARRLWQALPRRYHRHCWYFTDLFAAYVDVLPRWQHRRCPKGDGGTSVIEAVNCSLRQRCGVLVRKACSFSKSLAMHNVRIIAVLRTVYTYEHSRAGFSPTQLGRNRPNRGELQPALFGWCIH